MIDIAFNASHLSKPSLTARAAQSGRWCRGITGLSVVIDIFIPALFKTPAVLNDLFTNSTFVLCPRLGPTIIGKFSSANSSTIHLASVE